jgi:hypothetical protein
VFTALASALTVWQNWRTEEQHDNAYAWQIFVMEFLGE